MSSAGPLPCPQDVPGCEQCPEFGPCTRAFLDDVHRGMSGTINAGETSFNPSDLIGHGDLLRGITPVKA